jgi:hypothetical protein
MIRPTMDHSRNIQNVPEQQIPLVHVHTLAGCTPVVSFNLLIFMDET